MNVREVLVKDQKSLCLLQPPVMVLALPCKLGMASYLAKLSAHAHKRQLCLAHPYTDESHAAG